MDQEACLIEWYQSSGISGIRTAAIYCHQDITSDTLTIKHVNCMVLKPKRRTCRHVCLLHRISNNVTITPTNRNVGCSYVGSVCMYIKLLPDQLPSHYCHRVSRHLYHYACLVMRHRTSTHVWNQDSSPALISVQLHETIRPVAVHMSLNFALKQQACLWQFHPTTWHNCTRPACISVRAASTFVVVGPSSQQVYLLHLLHGMSPMLVPNQQAGKQNCTRPSGMYVTVAPDQQPRLYMLPTISMHVCYSFTLSTSMYVMFAPNHQPCL